MTVKAQIVQEMTDIGCFKDIAPTTTHCSDLFGKWRLLLNVSDPCDKILEACGVSRIRRVLFKSSVTETWIDAPNKAHDLDENGLPPQVCITTVLPMNNKRELLISMDGTIGEYQDDFTHETWKTCGFWDEQTRSLLLRRCSSHKGTHYDLRRVYKDGTPIGEQGPVMLFRWVVVTTKGEILKADRWLQHID